MKLTRKKARKLSKKRANIDKFQKAPEGTKTHGNSPWRSNIDIGDIITIRSML
jgi:hypothetical protein